MRSLPPGSILHRVCIALLSLTLAAQAGDFTYRKVIDRDTQIPERSTKFSGFEEPIILPSGQVAFIGYDPAYEYAGGIYRANTNGSVTSIADNLRLMPGQTRHILDAFSLCGADAGIAFTTDFVQYNPPSKAWIYNGTYISQPLPARRLPGPSNTLRHQFGSLWIYPYSPDPDAGQLKEPWRIRNGQMRRIATAGVELHPGSGMIYKGIVPNLESEKVTGLDDTAYFTARYVYATAPTAPDSRGLFSADLSTSPISYRAVAAAGRSLPGISGTLASNFRIGSFAYDGESLLFKADFSDGTRSIVRGRNGTFARILNFPYMDELGRTVTDATFVSGGFGGRVFFRSRDTGNAQVSLLRPDGANGYTVHRVIGINDVVDGKLVQEILLDQNGTSTGDSIALVLTMTGRPVVYVATLGNQAPRITGVDPQPVAPSTVAQKISILGSGFTSASALTFDPPNGPDIPGKATKLTYTSPTRLDYLFNNDGDVGAWTVRVTTPGQPPSAPFTFHVSSTAPATITRINPPTLPPSQGEQLLTITGTNLVEGTRIFFTPPGEAEREGISSKITLTPPHTISYRLNTGGHVGQWTVRVRPPEGESTSQVFHVIPAENLPIIESVAPPNVPPSDNGTLIRVRGDHFDESTSLILRSPAGVDYPSSKDRLSIKSRNELTYHFTNGGEMGIWEIFVKGATGDPDGPVGIEVALRPQTPYLEFVTPQGVSSAVTFTTYVLGAGFTNGTSLQLRGPGGAQRTIQPGDIIVEKQGTRIKGNITPALQPGVWTVTAQNPGGAVPAPWTSPCMTLPKGRACLPLPHSVRRSPPHGIGL